MSNKNTYYLGVDIGGSHIATGIVAAQDMRLLPSTVQRYPVDSHKSAQYILDKLLMAIKSCVREFGKPVTGIGISMPGPFDYETASPTFGA